MYQVPKEPSFFVKKKMSLSGHSTNLRKNASNHLHTCRHPSGHGQGQWSFSGVLIDQWAVVSVYMARIKVTVAVSVNITPNALISNVQFHGQAQWSSLWETLWPVSSTQNISDHVYDFQNWKQRNGLKLIQFKAVYNTSIGK